MLIEYNNITNCCIHISIKDGVATVVLNHKGSNQHFLRVLRASLVYSVVKFKTGANHKEHRD